MALQPRPDGALVVVAGASRSGKTVWTAQRVQRDRRVLVWDIKGQWSTLYSCRRISAAAELDAACRPGAKIERVAFVPPICSPKVFDLFCRYAWIWIRAARGSLVIEELADVTSPGKAPQGWGEICRKGLEYGPSIYAITQRPAESDKTAIGNATLLHCHQMAREDDEKYMAKELRVDQAEVGKLLPLQWIERDRLTHQNRRGTVNLRTLKQSSRALRSARG